MALPAIAVRGLVKRYGEITAVEDVSFEVPVGAVFAILGPNGAGKTTTVEVLEGFRRRDGGEVRVLGFDPSERATARQFRSRLGIVLQELALEPFLTVREVLARNANYYPDPRPVDEVIEAVGLAEKANERVKTLSGGQQRRLDLGLGIVGNPELIFLDEPTTGFDPSARRGAWEVVRSLCAGGTTVLLTTHYMDEAEALASEVAVMSNGRIVASGPPQRLGGRDVAEVTIRFELPEGYRLDELPIPGATLRQHIVEFTTGEEVEVLHRLTGWSLDHKAPLIGLEVERLTLEDIYLRLTGGSGQ